jgi:hypothetical protein
MAPNESTSLHLHKAVGFVLVRAQWLISVNVQQALSAGLEFAETPPELW